MKITSIEKVGKRKVYDISVADVEHYILENGVVSHNSGLMYSCNQAFIIGKSQEKDGTELLGYNFTINIEKSRFVREKSKLPFTVTYEEGVHKYSGLLDLAKESGHVISQKVGWFTRVDKETGEIADKNYRAKDLGNAAFWDPILKSPSFDKFIKDRFQLSANSMMSYEESTDSEGEVDE